MGGGCCLAGASIAKSGNERKGGRTGVYRIERAVFWITDFPLRRESREFGDGTSLWKCVFM